MDKEILDALIDYIDKKVEYELAGTIEYEDGQGGSCVDERKAMEAAENVLVDSINIIKPVCFFNIHTNLIKGPITIGYENDPDNFYLKCEMVGDEPLITGRILDNKGNIILLINQNTIIPDKYRINKFTIKRTKDNFNISIKCKTIVKMETRNEIKGRITYIHGQFHDKNMKLAAYGNDRGLSVNCPIFINNKE